jgi:hypothetical protein
LGLFGAYTLVTAVALVALAVVLAVAGVVAVLVGIVAALLAGVVIAAYLVTGDSVPVVLYLLTIPIGISCSPAGPDDLGRFRAEAAHLTDGASRATVPHVGGT